ncbi:protein rep [Bacillus cereus group sp. BfR-BA-01455]|uniref:protein rep n=1 Tax=Bacillus cereus group sp. BfR-BA-01455 TaxID=2920357 RepID=UPI001F583481|nr:protein rep [Bacillus cereus group sp. BfR-BA-01455]
MNKFDNLTVLSDVRKSDGKEIPWQEKKERSIKMAEVFQEAGLEKKATRMCTCGNVLVFNKLDQGIKLAYAQFCQVRLCPMCTWRRSLKIATQNKQIVEVANERHRLRWIFLTLTIKNVKGHELKDTVKHLMKSWNRFMGYKRIEEANLGWFRGLEITRDKEKYLSKKRYKNNPRYYDSIGIKAGDRNPNYNTYHPHFHVLIAVSPSYFKKNYIKQAEWTSLWKRAIQVDYNPIVDVRPVKAKKKKKSIFDSIYEIENAIEEQNAVFEVSKYPVKDTDIVNLDDIEESAEVVKVVDDALQYTRLIAYGGLLKDIKKELGLSDAEAEDTDLIQIDESQKDEIAEEIQQVTAYWHFGLKNYVLQSK